METPALFKRLAKLDVADAVGVYVREDVVAVALVRKRFQRVYVAERESLVLDGPREAHDAEIAAMIRGFVGRHRVDGARLALVLERSDSLVGALQLPATAAANVAKVVEYELDRIMPISGDQLYHGYYTRSMGTDGERIAVSVVAAPRTKVDALMALMAEAGAPPTAVTVQPAALCDYVAFCRGDAHKVSGIFSTEGEREYLTLCAEGRMISGHRRGRAESRMLALQKEVERGVPEYAGREAEVLVWCGPGVGEVALPDIAPADFFGAGPELSEAELVAVGGALGQLGESGARLNLLPDSMVRVEQGIGMREIALSALVAVLALVLVASIGLKNLGVSNALAAELARLEPIVTKVSRQEEDNRRIAAKLDDLEDVRREGMMQYLRALTVLVPKSAYLTTFRFRNNRLEVDGIADNASELIPILEKSPQFKGVEFTAPTTKYLQDKERFSLRMGFEKS